MSMQALPRNGFTTAQVMAALHGPRTEAFRYELLDKTGAKKADLTTVLAGSVAHNATAAIKRTARFTLADTGQVNFLSDRIKPFHRLWVPPGRVMRAWIHLLPWQLREEVLQQAPGPGGWVEFPQGVFLLSTAPRKTDTGGVVTREVEAYDLAQVLLDDKVADRASSLVTTGTNYVAAVKVSLESAGITDINIPATDKVLPADIDWAAGTPKLQIIGELLRAINYTDLWFDGDGWAVSAPYVSPDQRSPEYTYRDDAMSVMLPEMEQALDLFSVPNQWVLTVSEPGRSPLTYTYTNSNPNSPTSTVSRGRTIVAAAAADAPDLEALEGQAKRLAFEASQVYETVSFSTGLMPMHGHADVYTLGYTKLGFDAKFAEVEWSMDLAAGATMQHKVQRILTV